MTNTNRQQGFIALTITLIILLLVISLSIMTGKVLVEQRIAANEIRYREALANAEARLEQGLALIASAGVSTLPRDANRRDAGNLYYSGRPPNAAVIKSDRTGKLVIGGAGLAKTTFASDGDYAHCGRRSRCSAHLGGRHGRGR